MRFEYVTLAWNLVEGGVVVSAALIAGSVAILGFGIDSFVECSSARVMIWRLRAERGLGSNLADLDAVKHRARRLVAGSFARTARHLTAE